MPGTYERSAELRARLSEIGRSRPRGGQESEFWLQRGKIDELTRLWNEKTPFGHEAHTASEIGKLIGCSKNAVVAKAHRLHLAARESPIRAMSTAERAQRIARGIAIRKKPGRSRNAAATGVTRPARAPKAPVPANFQYPAEPSTNGASMRFCNWPRWEHRQHWYDRAEFCGEKQDPTDPRHRYCAWHRLVSTVGEERAKRIASGQLDEPAPQTQPAGAL